MATTRDRQSSLRRIVPDRTRSSSSDSKRNNSEPNREILVELDSAEIAELGNQAVIVDRAPIDCTERFQPQFVDPQFPVEQVNYSGLKRAFDIVFSAIFMLSFSWLYLILALGVRLTSRGPILFKQIRVGRGGRYFHCYKFRSMCVDAEAKKEQLMHLNEATGPVFKIKQDPRITRIGHFMRRFSMDEFPQFVNVLKGDMSVVGPRPPITSEVEMYSVRDRRRLAVQPGLTCLWQVNGRCNLTFEQWVELDLKYIDTMSFGNDLMIVLKTIPAVLTGAGAH